MKFMLNQYLGVIKAKNLIPELLVKQAIQGLEECVS